MHSNFLIQSQPPDKAEYIPKDRKHFRDYVLNDLITDYSYEIIAELNGIEAAIKALQLPEPSADRITVIGINGPTCAGKTSFSHQMKERFTREGIPAVEVPFDWFLYDRGRRNTLVDEIANQRRSIQEVTQVAWDVERYRTLLHKLRSSGESDSIILSKLYDRVAGMQTASFDLTLPYGGYAIVEGVGILDTGYIDGVDCYIRLDVDNDEILINRAIEREKTKPIAKQLSEEFLIDRFRVMDLDHMRHLRKISGDCNQYIIDASDFNNMKLFSRPI